MKVANSVLDLIGNTPIVKLNKLNRNTQANIYLKLESQNPAASVKDRLALAMIEQGEKDGHITADSIIIEPTSGNTGIGLAMVCAVKGYALKVVMPESVSIERRKLLSAYGAELVLTSAAGGMKEAISTAHKLAEEHSNSFMPLQFENASNAALHRKTTAMEIWNDLDGNVDAFVAGAGTGGTITGVSERLKELNAKLYSLVVEPTDSAVLSGKEPGPHKLQGIGAGFIPKVLNTDIYDEVAQVSAPDAFACARQLAKEEGVLAGISAGANLFAALELAKRPEFANKNIVVIIPDTGERYLSTTLFEEQE